MIKSIKSLTILVLTIFIFSVGNNITAQDTIKSVTIGEQTWMTENLNVDRFRNGDLIPEVKTKEEWIAAGKEGKPAWCYYDNNSENGKKYGKFYNWFAVNDKRGLAPEGWHIPTKKEFETILTTVKKNVNALKSIGEGEGGGAGTNTSGFSALLAGFCGFAWNFGSAGMYAYFWSSTEGSASEAYELDFFKYDSGFNFSSTGKEYGFNVRCLRD